LKIFFYKLLIVRIIQFFITSKLIKNNKKLKQISLKKCRGSEKSVDQVGSLRCRFPRTWARVLTQLRLKTPYKRLSSQQPENHGR
jgi:hypothetical protein